MILRRVSRGGKDCAQPGSDRGIDHGAGDDPEEVRDDEAAQAALRGKAGIRFARRETARPAPAGSGNSNRPLIGRRSRSLYACVNDALGFRSSRRARAAPTPRRAPEDRRGADRGGDDIEKRAGEVANRKPPVRVHDVAPGREKGDDRGHRRRSRRRRWGRNGASRKASRVRGARVQGGEGQTCPPQSGPARPGPHHLR